ncbi:two-component system sensor histidine kinase UhpB [Oxalobacteraceae bacterium GrIS 1.11]
MNMIPGKTWSISARLILITIMPVVMMFCCVVLSTYYSRLGDVREELAERGRVIATALADSSEYGVISGNFTDLKRIANGLVRADNNIFQIDILNADQHIMLRVTSDALRDAENRVFDAPIKKQLLAIGDYLDPDLPAAKGGPASGLNADIVGYVRVTMSPSNMVAKQTYRVYIQCALTLLVLLATVGVALYLGRSLSAPLAAIVAALRDIRAGHYALQIPLTAGGEIGDLQASINAMSVSLHQATQSLENKVLARTKDLEASRNEAMKSDAEKRKLIQKVNSIVEDERKSIAIEIHDELNAILIAARLNSQRILSLATRAAPSPDIDEIKAKAESTIKLTLDLYASARNIVRRLRPEVLDMLGLHGAVEEMLHNYERGQHDCEFNFQSAGDFRQLESGLAITAYRLIQEALSNVVKHAQASKTTVSLFLIEEENCLQIGIADNGKGFDPASTGQGIGLIGMRERVYGVAGRIAIHTGLNKGTSIMLRLPLVTELST